MLWRNKFNKTENLDISHFLFVQPLEQLQQMQWTRLKKSVKSAKKKTAGYIVDAAMSGTAMLCPRIQIFDGWN